MSSSHDGIDSTPEVTYTESEWREKLTPEEFAVLRQAGTERPFVGEYTDTTTEGVYSCRASGAALCHRTAKFESHCGWPCVVAPAHSLAVIPKKDRSPGLHRVKVP